MALNHNFGDGSLRAEEVFWPGDADAFRSVLSSLREQWLNAVQGLDDAALADRSRAKWPLTDCPFIDVVAWLNAELMKNAAELGYTRFLYAVQAT